MIQTLLKRSDLDYATFTDSVSKFRVSNPESLIDTDFEYGLQSIKWETIMLVNNIPLFFSRSGDTPIPVTNVTTTSGTDYIYVTTASAHNLIDGSPIYISGLKAVTAEGYFIISKILSTTQFVYKAKYTQTVTGSLFDANTTYLFPGMVYQGTSFTSDQLVAAETDQASVSTITVTTQTPHGFSLSNNFALAGTVGRRAVGFNGASVNTSTSTITTTTNHGFYNGMSVVYSRTGGDTDIPNLTNNTTYVVSVVSANSLRLGTDINNLITFTGTGTGTGYLLTTLEDASDSSTYSINAIPSSTQFALSSSSYATAILGNQLVLTNFRSNIVQQADTNSQRTIFVFGSDHKAITGAPVDYSFTGTSLTGMAAGRYYAIRLNRFALKLANTYNNAINNIATVNVTDSVQSSDTTSTHTFLFRSILGEVPGSGFVTCSNATNIVTGTNLNFLSFFKKGDIFKIVPPVAEITYAITANPSSGLTITLNTLSGISTGTPLRYVGTQTYGTFTTGGICYAGVVSAPSLQIRVYPTYASSLSVPAAGYINITESTGNIFRSVPLSSNITTIFESPISIVNNSTTLTLSSSNVTGNHFINANYMVSSTMFPFSDSYVYHRAHDGGIELNPSNNPNAQIIRQTRKYFRYQPGKGIQCSLSVNFSAPIEIDYLSRSGLVATARTRKPHRLSNNLWVILTGATDSAWNVRAQITVLSVNTFQFTLPSAPTGTVAGGYPVFTVDGWSGSALRAGLFDDQNGMFFEYDGTTMYAVRRDSVTQISGLVDVTFRSSIVTQSADTNTAFTTQVAVGDNIVIRGQTYRVSSIENDITLYIQPPYRGATDQNVLVSRVVDTKVPRTSWSIDKCDGTGPTGYVLNVNRIQMIYMDYSWYGAGKIRFGFKDKKGEVRYVHEFLHNNNVSTAYFRSGNLPARYEVLNGANPQWVPPLLHWGTAIIMDGRYDDDKAYLFTASANVLNYSNGDQIRITGSITNPSTQTTVYDPYIQRSTLAYNLLSAGGAGSSNSWQSLQNLKTGTLVTGAGLSNNTFTLGTPQKDNIDTTRAIIYINRQPISVQTNQQYTFGDSTDIIPNVIPLVSVRISPSVDSSITGPLGVRELITRMQLRLRSVDILTTNDTELRLVLNGFISNRNFVNAPSPSLSQYIAHVKGDTIQDGTVLFSYRVPGGIFDSSGKRTSTVTSYDVSGIGFLGNSIQGGDNIYPDGPDVLTLVAVCLDPAGVSATTPYTVSARVSWAEAQA